MVYSIRTKHLDAQLTTSIRLKDTLSPSKAGTARRRILLHGKWRPTRRFIVEDMNDRVYLNWKRVRVVDYVGDTRCYKCQQYGHTASYCKMKRASCGHCAEEGHVFRRCPSLQGPAKCATCKSMKRNYMHGIESKTCPSFLEAAKQAIYRAAY